MSDDLNAAASYCPTCGAEYREGFSVCADDGTELVPGPKPLMAPEPAMSPEPTAPPVRWVRVATFLNEDEANLLGGRLAAEGIESQVEMLKPGGYGRAVGAILQGGVSVFVREEQETQARAVMSEIEAG